MADRLTVGDWIGSAASIHKLFTDACSIEEEGPMYPQIQLALKQLQDALSGMLRSIDSADRGRLIRSDTQATSLVSVLKDVFYEADDLLDDIHFEILSTKMRGDEEVGRSFNKVGFLFTKKMVRSFNKVGFLFTKKMVRFHRDLMNLSSLARKLSEVIDVQTVAFPMATEVERFSTLSMPEMVIGREDEKEEIVRISTSCMPDIVIGREDEKEEIVRILLSSEGEPKSWDKRGLGSSSGRVFDVLPLVGTGGIGKTTLAQLVFNDERVKVHFDTRAWCWMFDDFDIERISKELLYILSDDLSDTISDMKTTVIMKLKHVLSSRRFFIVFDDVWDEKPDHWEMLASILTCGARGSKVLVTTRSVRVARIMGTMGPIMVKSLSEDECWALSKRLAFGDGNLEYYLLKKDGKLDYEERRKLEPIGMQICRKLGGLPLAAKVLGSRLRTELDENYWRAISESELWELDFVSEGVLSTLKLSYQHLNADLRRCFAYCSIFPKGYRFEKLKLVQMWLAQGYIKLDEREEMKPEDIGSLWFCELMDRCFFQPAEENSYVMHDMIHDLAVSISLDDCFLVEDESENFPYEARHLVVRTDKLDVFKQMRKFKSLRTLLFFGNYNSLEFSKALKDMFMYLKGLRVLDLSSTPIEKLPNDFGGLSHLRYLDISNTKIRLLPASFSKLCHLQVLNLKGCHFKELPKDMNKLINLRYLYGDSEIVSLIKGIGELTNLYYLEEFPVKQKRGHGIGELKSLKKLQGRLSIKNLENVKTKEEAMEAELKNKMHLKALQLEWSSSTRNQPDVEKEVLEGLQPHPNLEELSIMGYDGVVYPNWMVSSPLLSLKKLSITNCPKIMSLPENGLPMSLEELHISGCPALRERCSRGTGLDWPKIAHIPLIHEEA